MNLQETVTDDFDLDEATKIAKREFEFDAQGHETMDKTLFFSSFFSSFARGATGPPSTLARTVISWTFSRIDARPSKQLRVSLR